MEWYVVVFGVWSGNRRKGGNPPRFHWREGWRQPPPEVSTDNPVRNAQGSPSRFPPLVPVTLGSSEERSWSIMCTVGMADTHDRVKGNPE